ncbi:hypothetical protein HYQ46_005020 [Verticillium longisporum]|nr:hypothetical protein HYQ46_005020 [Verticillium longisporum]
MVGTGAASRWHKLRAQMLRIRHGPGAAVIPPTVTRIHVEFAKTYNNGHMGPRRFWRDMLPRLKFHNPSIPMIPPSSGIDTSKAAPPAADERVVKIDMKNQRSEEILARFLAETGAQPVLPTPEEQAEMKEVEEMERQGAVDRKKQKATIDERNRERDLLKKARESVID